MSKHARAESNGEADGLRHPSTKRAKEVDAHTPMDELAQLLEKQPVDHTPRTVLHWFRSKDLRMQDNRALHAASQKAQEGKGNLITMYLYSPMDLEWHGTSPARSDFLLRNLHLLRDELKAKNIPLAIVTADDRAAKVDRVVSFVKEHDVSHIYANIEYEVDELRRDIKFAKAVNGEDDIGFVALHDQTAMKPGFLTTGGGGPHKVFTPYHKAWLAEVKSNPSLLDLSPDPAANGKDAEKQFKSLFDTKLPTLPKDKGFVSKDEEKRIQKMWPAGHEAGMQRLSDFLKKKVSKYAEERSLPAKDPSSRLSPYFSAGVISVREALQKAKEHDDSDDFGEGDVGVASWVREIVFREFYRQMLVITPHNAMNMPQNLKFDFVEWEDDDEGWRKWCEGTTGVPFVDAGMRQLNTEAYMHNRLRMNTASYLRANLLIDYRRGERYFAEHLIDWDLSNNTQGWEPSYTVFNPVVQAEKCDKEGEYIRKWVPELKDVQGKAVFAPHERLSKAEFEKLGYPRPHVDFTESKERAVARYKSGLADADP